MMPNVPIATALCASGNERLLIGWSGSCAVLLPAIRFCRLAGGLLLHRERGVIVVEVCATPEQLESLLAQLPQEGLTHLNRVGRPGAKRRPAASVGQRRARFV